MFGSSCNRVRELAVDGGILVQARSIQHGYGRTKAGRGTIKTEITHPVYWVPGDEQVAMGARIIDFYGAGRKSHSNKVFNGVKKHGVAGYQHLLTLVDELAEDMKRDGVA